MPAPILPPETDEVEFSNVNLKLTPGSAAKIKALQEQTGLNRAKIYAAMLATAQSAWAGDAAKVAQWKAYIDSLKLAKAQVATPPK